MIYYTLFYNNFIKNDNVFFALNKIIHLISVDKEVIYGLHL